MRPRASPSSLLAVLSCAALSPWAAASTPLPAPVVKRIAPAVVGISSRRAAELDFTDARSAGEVGSGSGVVIDARQGYVVTNAHLLTAGGGITVLLPDGRALPATLVGSDEISDVALLKIAAEGLKQIDLGDSTRVELGDY